MRGAVDSLSFQARVQPGRPAVIDLERGLRWTYGQFDEAVQRCVSVLRNRGLKAGDRVGSLAKNRPELIMLQVACMRAGLIYAPLNWRLAPPELQALVGYLEPGIVFGDALLEAAGIDGVSIDLLEEEIASAPAAEVRAFDRDAPALILLTSGTSGLPKGAVLSERNITETAISFSLVGRIDSDCAVLCEAPMFHVMGCVTNIHPTFMRGGKVVISDGFLAPRTLARLGDPDLAITHYFCVPQMAQMLRRDPSFDPRNLRNLRAILSGGAPHPAANINQWLDDGIPIVDGFGMSETGTVSGMPLDIDLIRSKAGSVGVVHGRMAYRILDDDLRDVPPGIPGELCLRGDNVCQGYWRRPEESRAALVDGWFRTGDVVREDEDGFLWIVDRKKDMFISGGENVYPVEIEAVLAAFDDVLEAAVVGWADERWGQVGHLFVVLKPGVDPDQSRLLQRLTEKLARYKVPKHVTYLDRLPRNGAGKIEKNKLRQ